MLPRSWQGLACILSSSCKGQLLQDLTRILLWAFFLSWQDLTYQVGAKINLFTILPRSYQDHAKIFILNFLKKGYEMLPRSWRGLAWLVSI